MTRKSDRIIPKHRNETLDEYDERVTRTKHMRQDQLKKFLAKGPKEPTESILDACERKWGSK